MADTPAETYSINHYQRISTVITDLCYRLFRRQKIPQPVPSASTEEIRYRFSDGTEVAIDPSKPRTPVKIPLELLVISSKSTQII